MILAPPILESDVAWSHFDITWGHFNVAWQILWLKNDVFDELLGCAGHLTLPEGCAGHLTLPEKKWAPVAVKFLYKYDWGKSWRRHTALKRGINLVPSTSTT